MKLTIDFETRSEIKLKERGIMPYAVSESTEVICCAFKEDNKKTLLWVADKFLDKCKESLLINEIPLSSSKRLKRLIEKADIIEGHNVNFERNIYNHKLKPCGWPEIPEYKWRCSAAKAAVFALPRSLEGAGSALGLGTQKDKEGHRIMLKLCKPRIPTRNNPSKWHEKSEEFIKLFKYCVRDADTEHAISNSLRDIKKSELEVWRLDQVINNRGIYIDTELCQKAIELISEHEEKLMAELYELTNGVVNSPKQRDKLLTFLNKEMEDAAKMS